MYSLLDFTVHGNHTGSLVALEKGPQFPFDIKRVFYIWGNQRDVVRGEHAHRTVEQVIICTSGSCDFTVNTGITTETFHLNNPAQGLYIKCHVWGGFTNFSPDCVLMVLASGYYTEDDYIRDYDTFLREIAD